MKFRHDVSKPFIDQLLFFHLAQALELIRYNHHIEMSFLPATMVMAFIQNFKCQRFKGFHKPLADLAFDGRKPNPIKLDHLKIVKNQ